MNFYQKDDLQMEFHSIKNEMVQEAAFALFVLYDLYDTNTAHEQ